MIKLAIIILSVAVLYAVADPKCFDWRNTCLKKTGVTDHMLLDALDQNKANHKKYKDHLICIAEKAGVLGDDGNYHQDKLMPGLLLFDNNRENMEALIQKCWVDKKTTKDTLTAVLICVLTQLYKDGKFN